MMIRTNNSFVPPKMAKVGVQNQIFFTRSTREIILYPHFKIRGTALGSITGFDDTVIDVS